jgi:hypothetical protein
MLSHLIGIFSGPGTGLTGTTSIILVARQDGYIGTTSSISDLNMSD